MRKRSLGVVFVIVAMDLIGFGLILPLLPLYADKLGATPLFVGLLFSIYSLMQFLMNPFWGGVSDRFGRRPVILFSLAGSTLSYLAYGSAEYLASTPEGTLAVLLGSRMVAGALGANITTSQAYVADLTTPENRARGMGIVGAAIGLGFVVGPALGSLVTHSPILEAYGLGLAGYVGAVLCLGNLVGAWMWLGESHPPEKRGATGPRPNRLATLSQTPTTWPILTSMLLVTMAFSQMESSFALFGVKRFDLVPRDIGILFAYTGLVVVVMQGGFTRPLVARLGEARVVLSSGLVLGAGLLAMALAEDLSWVLIGLGLIGVGMGLAQPSLFSLLSRSAPSENQGLVLGLGQSVSALARILGPAIGMSLFAQVSMRGPYWLGSAMMVGVVFMALLLIRKPTPVNL
ncbi:MAG: MFS transporter [Deltaproteobacteria bacterium]|nr:MFS transporter [Deltaproteobacteria bacterium]